MAADPIDIWGPAGRGGPDRSVRSEAEIIRAALGADVRLRVWRGEGNAGGFEEYRVPRQEGMVVLDALFEVQAHEAPDLAIRWNCKAGKCGSCSMEINGHPRLACMTRLDVFPGNEPITVAPLATFPLVKDLVTDVSFNYEKAKSIPPFQPRPKEPDGTRRMYQEEVEGVQEFHKCIECFLCQDVCHVIRDHPENKQSFSGPRFFIKLAALEMHPLDTADRLDLIGRSQGLGFCNITKCCTEVCPEHIKITDNGIIPLKERVVTEFYDPLAWVKRRVMGERPTALGRSLQQARRAPPDEPQGPTRAGQPKAGPRRGDREEAEPPSA